MSRVLFLVAAVAIRSAAAALTGAAPAAELPAPPGPHVGLTEEAFAGSRSFTATNRLVGTYYFYWYDSPTQAHILDEDGTDALTTHPPTLEGFSYKSAAWHRKQLLDMMAAGIDFLLPVFWGDPSEGAPEAARHWSYAGLPPLVEARDALVQEGREPPRLGLFYDTSTLRWNRAGQHIDLTTDFGRRWFYATIRGFYSMIPPRHWAMIERQPLVFLYSAVHAKRHDQSCIDYVKQQFPRDFGGRVPYLVREASWKVQADNTVVWGGAFGLRTPGIASLGPGYDHSAVPGRTPVSVDRRGGRFYEESWVRFLRRPSAILVVETWNEFHEATDICESREYGRQYLELTRRYTDRFRQGWRPPWPVGPYSFANSVQVVLGRRNVERGLRQVESEDGRTVARFVAGREGRATSITPHPGRYLYFVVDNSFKRPSPTDFRVDVEYCDTAAGTLALEYDGSDATKPLSGAYTRAPETLSLLNRRGWGTVRFQLPAAAFLNSQNQQADFRLVVMAPELIVGAVRVLRP
jgi:hypothetical protein